MAQRSRRWVLALGAEVSGLTGLAGAACAPGRSGGGAGGQAPAAGALAPGTKVAFASWGNPTVQEIYKRAAGAFQQQHQGVTAEFVSTAGQGHVEKVTAAAAAGTPFDVFLLSPNDTPTFVARGLARGLDDLVARDRYNASDFFEKSIGQYRWKGKLYGLPRGFGNQDVYYNTTLFDVAGLGRPPYDWNARTWTVEEFLEAATRLAGTAPAGAQVWGWDQGTGLRQWGPWVWIFGGDILNTEGTASVLDQQPAVEGLQFLQDLIHKHRVMPPPSANFDALNGMGNGQIGMAMGIPAQLGRYRALQGLSFDVAPMPRAAKRVTSGGGVAWHMASTTASVNAAWELHKWIASKEVQTEECAAGTVAPPRKSVLRSPCFVDRTQPPKGLDVFVQAPEFVHPDPQAVGWDEIEEHLSAAFAALWDGSRMARQVTQEVVPLINNVLRTTAR